MMEPYYEAMLELSRSDTDWDRYVELIQTGAKAGDDHAIYALANMYLHGFDNVQWKQNTRLGLRLLRRATRSVHMAMTELASYYEGGEHGLRTSNRHAFLLFEKAARFGSVAGRFHLGRCYYWGIGVRPDKRKGARLFRSAVTLGFPWPPEADEEESEGKDE